MKNSFFIFILAFSAVCRADVYDIPEVKPIINQLYPSNNELSASLIYFPVGAFNKHIGFGGSYLKLDNPNHGWEVLSAYYFTELASGLKKSVIEGFGAQESDFPVLKYIVKTGYTYVPFYSKSIFFNTYMIHSRSYLNLSAGLADYRIEKPTFISGGFGQNFYYGKDSGIKFEVNYMNFFKKSGYIQNQLTISVGMIFEWGRAETDKPAVSDDDALFIPEMK